MKKSYVLILTLLLIAACDRGKKISDVKSKPIEKEKKVYGGVYTHRIYSATDDVAKETTSVMPVPGTKKEDLQKKSSEKDFSIDRAIRDPNTGLLKPASTTIDKQLEAIDKDSKTSLMLDQPQKESKK